MAKKVYRSLFDSDEVYEVEELTDEPEISTSGVAAVKTDGCGGPAAGAPVHTVDECWDAIEKLTKKVDDALFGGKSNVKDGNEPATEMKVEPQKVEIDKSNPVNAQDADPEEKDAPEDSDKDDDSKASKEVKDTYAAFTRISGGQKVDPATATQIAFQKRYEKVANK